MSINGEVFIVTKGGNNIKLGLVEVQLFPKDTLQTCFREKIKHWSDVSPSEAAAALRPGFLCNDNNPEIPFPKALLITKTNSDGQFQILVPSSGQYVIVADADRQVFDRREFYYWLIPIDQKNKTIILSNDNLATIESCIKFISRNSEETEFYRKLTTHPEE